MRRRGGCVASRTRSRRPLSPNIASPIDLSVWAPAPELQPEKRKARSLFRTVLNKDHRQQPGFDVNATHSGPSNGRRLVESGSVVQSAPLDLDGGSLDAQDWFPNNDNVGQSFNAVEVITQDDIPIEAWRGQRDGKGDQRSELMPPREDVEWPRRSRPTSDHDTSMVLFDREIAFTDDDYNTNPAEFNDTIRGIDLECSPSHSHFDNSLNDLSPEAGGRAATIQLSCQDLLSSSGGEDPHRPGIDSSPRPFFAQQSHAETLSDHESHRSDTLPPHASAQSVTPRPPRLQGATGTTAIPRHLSPHDPPLPLVSSTSDDSIGNLVSSSLICSSGFTPDSSVFAVAHPTVSIQSQYTLHHPNHDSATTMIPGLHAPVFPTNVDTSTTLSRSIPLNHGSVEGDDQEVEDTSLEYALLAQALYLVSL